MIDGPLPPAMIANQNIPRYRALTDLVEPFWPRPLGSEAGEPCGAWPCLRTRDPTPANWRVGTPSRQDASRPLRISGVRRSCRCASIGFDLPPGGSPRRGAVGTVRFEL